MPKAFYDTVYKTISHISSQFFKVLFESTLRVKFEILKYLKITVVSKSDL